MDKNHRPQSEHTDAILDIRRQKQVLKFVAATTLIFFVPIGINNILIGETMLGALLLTFEITLLLDVTAIVYKRKGFFGHTLPLILLVSSIILAIHIFGTLATYWVFPIIISVVFLLPSKLALSANVTLLVGCTLAAFPHQHIASTSRYAFSLLATAVIAHVIVQAIKRLQKELRYLSERDSMTGALNRHELQNYLDHVTTSYSTSSVAVIDIDKFKNINDQYGHDVGDKVIKQVVGILYRHMDESDLLFRLGGDEFLLLFPNKDQVEAKNAMMYISQNVRQSEYPEGATVTISSGIAEFLATESTENWVKRADLALYQSKHNGRDKVSLFNGPIPSYKQKETSRFLT
ncbi:GGDEF domain-containing protein [Vibrio zhanjiangensis]|uniref:diguanylate cyclase n=1 Tax=Vibrio zhanjiangensis TaxID=1046128 RepID=A0ABQ6F543_9VIBR|nr:GGDEF domain-containing protein [Vibrio zhanjiangensis]GLT20036.1 GGDEF domain-containing protein [Vibrio zhanjiangensis]